MGMPARAGSDAARDARTDGARRAGTTDARQLLQFLLTYMVASTLATGYSSLM